jgi:catechol 2,3-dioxygenase-like lactoylglutathione lyase family enzyme
MSGSSSERATFNHVSVSAVDMEASVGFYRELFGASPIPTPNFGFPVQWLRIGDRQLHLFERGDEPPAMHHFAIEVEDLDAVYELAAQRDCFDRTSFGHHLYELPGDCVQLYLRDPAGNLVEADARGVGRLGAATRAELRRLADRFPQRAENERATLFLDG